LFIGTQSLILTGISLSKITQTCLYKYMPLVLGAINMITTARQRRADLEAHSKNQQSQLTNINANSQSRNQGLNNGIGGFEFGKGTGFDVERLNRDSDNPLSLSLMHDAIQVTELDNVATAKMKASIIKLEQDFKQNGVGSFLLDTNQGFQAKSLLQRILDINFYKADPDNTDIQGNLAELQKFSKSLIKTVVDNSIFKDGGLSSSSINHMKTILMNDSESMKASAVLGLIQEIPLSKLSSETVRNSIVDNLGGGQVGQILADNLFSRLREVLVFDKSAIIKELDANGIGNESLKKTYLEIDKEVAKQFKEDVSREGFNRIINVNNPQLSKFKTKLDSDFTERAAAMMDLAESRYSDNPSLKEAALKRFLESFAEPARFLQDHRDALINLNRNLAKLGNLSQNQKTIEVLNVNLQDLDTDAKKVALKQLVKAVRDYAGDIYNNPPRLSEQNLLSRWASTNSDGKLELNDDGTGKKKLSVTTNAAGEQVYKINAGKFAYEIPAADIDKFLKKDSTDPINVTVHALDGSLSSSAKSITGAALFTEILTEENNHLVESAQVKGLNAYQLVLDAGLHGKNDAEVNQTIDRMTDSQLNFILKNNSTLVLTCEPGTSESKIIHESLDASRVKLDAEIKHLQSSYKAMDESIARGIQVFNPSAISSFRMILNDVKQGSTDSLMIAGLMESFVQQLAEKKVFEQSASEINSESVFYKKLDDLIKDPRLQVDGRNSVTSLLVSMSFDTDLEQFNSDKHKGLMKKLDELDLNNPVHRLIAHHERKLAFIDFLEILSEAKAGQQENLKTKYSAFLTPNAAPAAQDMKNYKEAYRGILGGTANPELGDNASGFFGVVESSLTQRLLQNTYNDRVRSNDPSTLVDFFGQAKFDPAEEPSPENKLNYKLSSGIEGVQQYLSSRTLSFMTDLASLLGKAIDVLTGQSISLEKSTESQSLIEKLFLDTEAVRS
jgi:hypothetical protein